MMQLADRSLGVGQSWQDVTASRALTTLYTNTTGRPIAVSIEAKSNTATAQAFGADLLVDGVSVAKQAAYSTALTYFATTEAIIPPGSTYQANATGVMVIQSWKELR